MITVGQLRKALDGLDDSLPVLVEGGSDHSYKSHYIRARVETVGKFENARRRDSAQFSEWYDEHNASPGEKPVQALVIEG